MSESIHSPNGIHYLMECSNCDTNVIHCAKAIETQLINAAKNAGATVIQSMMHEFNPKGISGVVIIAESHIAIHTWPKENYAAIEAFTCGSPEIAEKVYHNIIKYFKPQKHSLKKIVRKPPE